MWSSLGFTDFTSVSNHADKSTDIGGSSLPDSMLPHIFPAKLWRLVNNPENKAIYWNTNGDAIIIDQNIFERQILSQGTMTLDTTDAFNTTNFSSFIRQLKLYGFKKADPVATDSHQPTGVSGPYHHFCNPNFKRSHPELIASKRRMSVGNKAKLKAGLNMNCRPPDENQRVSGGDDGSDENEKRGKSHDSGPVWCNIRYANCL